MTNNFRIPTFVISLDRDAGRRAPLMACLEAQPNLEPIVVPAVNGSLLADAVCLTLTRRPSWARQRKGTIGCFLSHLKAWETIAALTVPFAIVLEDDTDAGRLGQVQHLEIPADADFVYLNERMSPEPKQAGSPKVAPLLPMLRRLSAEKRSGGTDGYLLTPVGAGKLVRACGDELYFGHVDGRVLRYASSKEDLDELGPETWLGEVIRTHHACSGPPPFGIVRAYTVAPPLVSHGKFESTRESVDFH